MAGSGGQIRVVVCDDVPGMRALLRVVLEEDPGVAVVGEAGDGQTGVELVAELQPDVVLLDLSMPRLDGLEAIDEIHRVAPQAKIVVFSGFAAADMAERALSRKASRYVEKGGALETVRDAVRDVAAAA